MTISPLDGAPNRTLFFIGGTPLINKEDSIILDAGYYGVTFNFINNIGQRVEREDILHIYTDYESRFEFIFTDAFFTFILVTSNANTGPGTLRQALIDAPANGSIVIDPSVREIVIRGSLTINKPVTIEGNGVIIRRDPFWSETDDSQLMIINPDSTTIISRVHFTNARANDFGSAIRITQATVTLESCIFSDNVTFVTNIHNSGGGAIFNSGGNLTVIGCTFYNNRTGNPSGHGGAIRTSGNLILAGNIFYNNIGGLDDLGVDTNNIFRIIAVNRTVISLGYNVRTTGSTFVYNETDGPGPGDTTFGNLGITGAPFNTFTFVPVTTGTLHTHMPSPLPSPLANFPITDFNRVTRTFPGPPGAVVQ
jgi:hypothetical protein